jgi:subtilisin-like proprotein convertase family protein
MEKNKIAQSFFYFLIAVGTVTGCSGGKFSANSLGSSVDPLLKYAWHLSNTGQKVFATTPAVSGYDLNLQNTWSQKIYGKGVLVQISDDGLEDTHEDLTENFSYLNQSKNYTLSSPFTATTAPPQASDDNHGTCVAGLVAAAGWNTVGSRGVAPKARLLIANFLSGNVTQTQPKYLDQASGDFDFSNMSWGITQNTLDLIDTSYSAQLKTMATTKRGGKGALFVKASGNDYAVLCNGSSSTYCLGNSNFDSDNTNPYIIVVAAMNSLGQSASYSSPGSDLWISSFGGEFGDDSPAMLTTDRMGCSKGYSVSTESSAFEKGASAENKNCNYTSTFNGTSSAAPTLTGVIALLLEANPALTWREVKYILAKTATVDNYVTGSIAHPLSYTMPTGYEWEQKWITNAAQFKFQNWFGFGRVNVDAAVTLAKSFITTPFNLGTYTETNWADANTGLSTAIPDFSATGATSTLNITTDLTVEAVQIQLTVTHSDISELAVELTSPAGTKSILINGRNSLTGISGFTGETFLSNAFYQESSLGNWTLKVVDTKTGTTGTLNSFKINFFGGAH